MNASAQGVIPLQRSRGHLQHHMWSAEGAQQSADPGPCEEKPPALAAEDG